MRHRHGWIATCLFLTLTHCESGPEPATPASTTNDPAPLAAAPAPALAEEPAPNPSPASDPAPPPGHAGGHEAPRPEASPDATPPPTMPNALGTANSSVKGCLAAPARQQQTTRRAMPPPPRDPAVTVTSIPGGLRIVHDVRHACCLTSQITSTLSGDTVTLTEALQGTPCRCMCASLIDSSVRLAPGTYKLRVVVEQAGGSKTAHEQSAVVAR